MSNGDLFYVCGGALAVSAVLVSFIGLRIKSFPGKAAPIVALGFVALIGATATFAVLHAKDEEEAKAAESRRRTKRSTKEEAAPVEDEGEKAPAAKPAAEPQRAPAAPCSSPPHRPTSPSTRRA